MSTSNTEGQVRRMRQSSEADTQGPSKRHDDGSTPKFGTVGVCFDVSKYGYNSNEYVAIIVPKATMGQFFEYLDKASVILHKDKENNVETDSNATEETGQNADDKMQQFSLLFDRNKTDMINTLKGYSDDELKKEVPKDKFDTFKSYRTLLTKWYVCCEHLKHKIVSDTASNRYLKIRYNFSPAVQDKGLRDSCGVKLNNTRKNLEEVLTNNVVDRANALNEEVNTKFRACIGDPCDTNLKILMKALRVVLRTNKNIADTYNKDNITLQNRKRSYRQYRQNDRNVHYRQSRYLPENRGNTDLYSRRISYRRRNDLDYQHTHDNYDDDYPPIRRRNRDYRTFKRRPADYNDTDDDEVFTDHRTSTSDRRSFRNYNRKMSFHYM